MNIKFENAKFADDCNDFKRLVRKFNLQRAKLTRRRLDDLRAAANLEVMRNLPGRCHGLKGDREGQLSVDLDGPFRLVFRPDHDPIPVKDNGGLDWSQVTSIVVLEVVDTHE